MKNLILTILILFLGIQTLAQAPIISVSPDSLVVGVLLGSTKTETLTISNQGGSNLYFDVSAGSYALQFDGINDVVAGLDYGFPMGNSNRTLELWFNRISQPTSEGTLMLYGMWWWYDEVYEILIADGGGVIFSQWGNGVNGNTIIQSNQWYHVAVENIGNHVQLYLNGELDASGNVNIYTVSNYYYLMGKGPSWDDLNKRFNGIIDEVRLWDVARTQQEIQQTMHQELDGSEQGLVGYWKFNEGTGNTAYDISINANHGSLQGGVTWTNSSAPVLPNWLSIAPDSGVCPPNSSTDIELLFDATEIDAGDYYGSLVVNSNDPTNPSIVVPIHMIVSTTVGVEYSSDIPIVFNLYQNYPNPFNPTTKISWQSPVSSLQTLKVYDILGNEVATLVDEYRPAGKYEVEFSAKGGSASGGNAYNLPSGVYFYQLKADNFIDTKKMILLK
jgi:hypothetical protein